MKSQFQILTFLNQYKPATELDNDMITAFIEKRYRITLTVQIFAQNSTFLPINTQSFLQWYENGYTASEIIKIGNKLGILGQSNLNEAEIIGTLEENTVQPCNRLVKAADLTKTVPEDSEHFLQCLSKSQLQFNPSSLTLEPKYIPKPNEKVLFHSYDFSINGIGIIRDIDTVTQAVELYCYFIYPTKTDKTKLGYSMHEQNIVNLSDFIFEPLLENNNRFSTDDGISSYRRMKRELEKAGKIWKDKLNRIEPSQIKRNKGEKYWYISDKLTVVQDTDKGTPTPQKRYWSGNYFITQESALKMQNRISEMLKSYLASSQWPNIDED